jgi:hypothetical protein
MEFVFVFYREGFPFRPDHTVILGMKMPNRGDLKLNVKLECVTYSTWPTDLHTIKYLCIS